MKINTRRGGLSAPLIVYFCKRSYLNVIKSSPTHKYVLLDCLLD
ncbi:MAG: hypothetical protein A4E65_02443 [Syntrophorhabdus sp. PtaU1.Bin153]|nr:MAG: hypothetical protein A4E65_02443 [Syntrophorhabdus sp. PtaU1.Bin153]